MVVLIVGAAGGVDELHPFGNRPWRWGEGSDKSIERKTYVAIRLLEERASCSRLDAISMLVEHFFERDQIIFITHCWNFATMSYENDLIAFEEMHRKHGMRITAGNREAAAITAAPPDLAHALSSLAKLSVGIEILATQINSRPGPVPVRDEPDAERSQSGPGDHQKSLQLILTQLQFRK